MFKNYSFDKGIEIVLKKQKRFEELIWFYKTIGKNQEKKTEIFKLCENYGADTNLWVIALKYFCSTSTDSDMIKKSLEIIFEKNYLSPLLVF